jgi:hypothetical protein
VRDEPGPHARHHILAENIDGSVLDRLLYLGQRAARRGEKHHALVGERRRAQRHGER